MARPRRLVAGFERIERDSRPARDEEARVRHANKWFHARTMFGRLGCLLVAVVVLLVVALAAAADTSAPADSTAHVDQQRPIRERDRSEGAQGELDLKTLDKQLFKRLFAKRRKEHLQAVNNLRKIDSYERQYKMIDMLAENMFQVIESKRALLENVTDSDLRNVSFAAESNTKTDIADAVSNVLENVALFGDVVLSLPDITRRVLRKQPKWNSTIRWSFEFLDRSRDLLDKSTLEMVKLVLQELNITKREAGYSSPNSIPRGGSANRPAPPKNAKKEPNKTGKKRKRGPTMTKVEL